MLRKCKSSLNLRFFSDVSASALTAGFVAVLVGFTSSVAIVFQAALAFGASLAQIASWMWALGLGMGLCSLVPSLWLRKPVMVAWSTPGAAVLATAGLTGGFTMADAVGAFMVCAALITLFGVTGWFEKIMNRIPMAVASALLAGVLTRFGLQAFMAAQTALALVLLMLGSYLVCKRWLPRYAVVVTLLVGIGARQGSCRLIYAAIGCITFSKWALMTQSRSGLSVTGPMGSQLRVFPDQRAGFKARACRYRSWRAARMA